MNERTAPFSPTLSPMNALTHSSVLAFGRIEASNLCISTVLVHVISQEKLDAVFEKRAFSTTSDAMERLNLFEYTFGDLILFTCKFKPANH